MNAQVRRQRGLSLLETVIALALAALLGCVVAPAAGSALQRARAVRVQSDLVESVLIAARHAVTGGADTVLCPSPSGADCRDGHDWSGGWLVFADLDGDRLFGARDTLLMRAPALAAGLRLHGSPGRSRIVFQPHGGSGGSNAHFTVCTGGGKPLAGLVLSNTGQFRPVAASGASGSHCATF